MKDSGAWTKYKHMVVIETHFFGGATLLTSTHLLNVSCGVNYQTLQVDNLHSSTDSWNALESLGFVSTEQNTLPQVEGSRALLSSAGRIALFTGPDYAAELQTPLEFSSNQRLFHVQLSVPLSDDAAANERLVVNECAAMHSESAPEADTRRLIAGGRAVDSGTAIVRAGARAVAQFRFHQTNSRQALHLRCEAIVCPNEDSTLKCSGPAARWQHIGGASRIQTLERTIEQLYNSALENNKANIITSNEFDQVELPKINFPQPKPITLQCDWTSFTVYLKSIESWNGKDYEYRMVSNSGKNCSSQEAGRNSSASWLKIPYDGDCGVDSEVCKILYCLCTCVCD